MTQATGFIGALDRVLLHGQGQSQRFRSYTVQEQHPNRLVQLSPRNALTGGASLGNTLALTQIVRHDTLPSTLVIAHCHPLAATPTEDKALQERWPLPWRGKTLTGCV